MPTPADGPDADAHPLRAAPEPIALQTARRGPLTEAERTWVYARLAGLRLSQRDLAHELGVSQPTITKWLSKERGLGVLQRVALARALRAEEEPLDAAPPGAVAGVHWNVEAAPPQASLPVYRWGAPASPLDAAARPLPESVRCLPGALSHLLLAAPTGFAVRVRGASMLGRQRRHLEDGDWCWIAPAAAEWQRPGRLVAVLVKGAERAADDGLTVRELGDAGAILAFPLDAQRGRAVPCAGYEVLGPVVRIERSLSPE